MNNTNRRNIPKPFILFKNNVVLDINKKFTSLTGYRKKEIIGKSILEISNLLKTSSQISFEQIENGITCFIFTKKNEPREVKISRSINSLESEKMYFFREKRHSRIENVMAFVSNISKDNSVGVAIFEVNYGIILKLNKKFLAFSNIELNKSSDYIGKKWKSAFNLSEESYRKYLKIIKIGKPCFFKSVKCTTHNNKDTFWDMRYVPIPINGKIKYLVQTAVDVTEIIVNKNTIEKQKQELEAIIENMSDELLIFNKNGKYTKINKSARDRAFFDFNKVETVDKAYEKIEFFDMNGSKLKLKDTPLKRVISGEIISNYRVIKKSNNITKYSELSGTPIYDSNGNLSAGVLVMRDISEVLKKEENLYIKAQYDSLKRIIDNLELAIARFSYPDLKFIDINNKGYSQFIQIFPEGCSQDSLIGRSVSDFYDNLTELHKEVKTFKNQNNSFNKTMKISVLGKEIFHKYIFQPLFGLNNKIIEIIVIGIDITEEENAKNILENTLKMQDEVYSNVSHELKTPLNVIFSANQVMEVYLKKDMLEKDKFMVYNDNIKQNCYRLIKLINNIVDLSRSDSGYLKINLENVNMVKIIEDIVHSVREYANSKKLSIVFDTNVEEKIIACDPNLIERVMLNLISNAIKFSEADSEILVSFIDKGATAEILVKDEGIGIDEEHINLLFERFYRVDKTLSRNTEGTGIGLSLIKSIVEQHGGNIGVESKFGQGSIFKVELPVRIIDNNVPKKHFNHDDNKIEKINIEFSDIYINE